jgi:hypothetical protein
MKHTFGISMYSKEYTSPILLNGRREDKRPEGNIKN